MLDREDAGKAAPAPAHSSAAGTEWTWAAPESIVILVQVLGGLFGLAIRRLWRMAVP